MKRFCLGLIMLLIFSSTGFADVVLLEGHTDNVWSVAFSPDGNVLASASWDNTIRLWNLHTGQHKFLLVGHTDDVVSVAFSPDGQTLASGSWDGTIRLWNPHTGQLKEILSSGRGPVASVVFSPDGSTLASGGNPAAVLLWDTTTWEIKRTLMGHAALVDAVVISPNGRILASGSRDKTVRLWDIHTGQLNHILTGHTSDVNRLAFSPDGLTLVSAGLDSVSDSVRLWNTQTGAEKESLTPHANWLRPVAFSPDGSTLAIGGSGISLWDTQTSQYLRPLTLVRVARDVVSIAFSPDGQTVASGHTEGQVGLSEFRAIPSGVPFADVPFDVTNIPEPVPPPPAVREFFELGPVYQQWISVAGYPVIGTAKVNPYALKEVAWVIAHMVGHRLDILKTLGEHGQRLCVVAVGESFGDLPEYDWYDHPVKFLARHLRDTPSTFILFASEEITLDPSSIYSFLIHEFTHVVEGSAVNRIDLGFDDRLNATYNAALAKGLWHGAYASTNRGEYLAEGAGSWFNSASRENPIKTRTALKTYDPGLAALLTEIFGDSDWRYTLPATRTHLPHLQGFDPQVPVRTPGLQPWQIWLLEVERQLIDANSDGGGRWVDFELYDPSQLKVLLESKSVGGGSHFIYVNLTGQELVFYTVAADGTETFRYRSTAHKRSIVETSFEYMDLGTYAGAIWLIKDHNGEDFAVFRAEKGVGRVLVLPKPHLITAGLSKVSGDNQEGVSGTPLANPFVIQVTDDNLLALEGISVTFAVTAGDGTLSVASTTTDKNGRAESTLTLGQHAGTNTVEVAVTEIQETQTFTAEGVRTSQRIRIVSGNDQQGTPSEALANPFVVEIQDENGYTFEGVPVTFTVTSGGGTLSATSATTDSNGRAESTLTLGTNSEANTVTVSVAGIQEEMTFTAEGIRIPNTLAIISGNDQEGSPGSALANPFVVEVRDQSDKPLAGVQVTFSVTAGGGTLSATSVTTDANGRAESTLTVGANPGANTVTVSVSGIQEKQTFTAEGIRTPKAFWIIAGFDQTGYIGEALPQPIVIEVRDRAGERLPGVEVTFSVASGGGTLSVTSAVTDSNGRAETVLTLGPEPGTNSVEVTVAGLQQSQTATAIAELPPVSEDVNRDDVVNVLDLVMVAGAIGAEGADLAADVNGDGIVNILDLVMVAGAL